jgi:tripartite-type tricarboxylate transporter receptor subunit TctC
MRYIALCFAATLLGSGAAAAQEDITFQGKTVSMIVAFASGGGTDAFARLAASFLGTHLPGSPSVVVRNVPGAEGITAMNFVVQQAQPDGLTVVTAASTTADPLNYRKPQSHFDPTTFGVVGGVGRGGSVILISKEAEPRLYDKRARPVVMGAPAGIPRSGMQMAAWGIEYLGWNAKWIVGYRGTNELMLALERGEIDMTSTANLFLLQKLIETGRFKILVQTGMLRNGAAVARPEFADAPVLAGLIDGKLRDPLAAKAFEYWSGIAAMDKWLALPPKAPNAMLDVYRNTYNRMTQEHDFIERGKRISDEFLPLSSRDVEKLIQRLASAPPGAIDYISILLRKQGLEVQ